ncbi:MAG: serine hydroxymethyltransferase [Promethearchaeota archaeon]
MKEIPPEIFEIIDIVKKQDDWRSKQTLNLIASENILSPLAQRVFYSDFHHRYAEGNIWHREYQGTKFIDELEQIVVDLAKKIFNAHFIEHRAISGGLANMAVYYALTKPDQHIFALSVPEGAHISFREFGVAGARGLHVHDIPFDKEKMNIDVEAFNREIERVKPDLITLGGSVFLFPHPISQIKRTCEEFGTRIHYDGAHVLGLIAGQQFQDPLKEGVDVLTGSTHKTFPGPQGALIMMNEKKIYKKINRAIFPGLVSNHHLGRMAPLAITLIEMDYFGKDYARQIISNAKALGKALDDNGFDVLAKDYGYTASHQIAVNVKGLGGGKSLAKNLEDGNIIANKNLLAIDNVNNVDDPSGLRFGVQEVTRKGMKENEMGVIAGLIRDALLKKEKKDIIKEKVQNLLEEFKETKFCFPISGF